MQKTRTEVWLREINVKFGRRWDIPAFRCAPTDHTGMTRKARPEPEGQQGLVTLILQRLSLGGPFGPNLKSSASSEPMSS